MALAMYLGVPGSGKSYGVMKYVIIPELRKGSEKCRHIFTNVYGIKLDKLSELVGWDVSTKLHVVTNKDVELPWFFPNEAFPQEDWIVQPGALVVLDEANRFIASGEKVGKHVTNFVNEHRHMVGPDKTSTDIVLVTQAYGDLNRTISKRTEVTYNVTKLTIVGRDDEFRVDFYSGYANPERAKPYRSEIQPFDPVVWDMYESYHGGVGVEKQIDERGNFWDQKLFKGLLGKVPYLGRITYGQARWGVPAFVFVPVVGFIVYYVYSLYTHPERMLNGGVGLGIVTASDVDSKDKDSKAKDAKDVKDVKATPATAKADVPSAPAAKDKELPPGVVDFSESTELRLVGIYRFNGLPMAVMATNDGRLRYADSTQFSIISQGPASYIMYGGKKVSYWTGSVPNQQKQSVSK